MADPDVVAEGDGVFPTLGEEGVVWPQAELGASVGEVVLGGAPDRVRVVVRIQAGLVGHGAELPTAAYMTWQRSQKYE